MNMMSSSHILSSDKQKGFTIVELLIVIVVIGILAAITIVAFNGVQNRSYKSAAQSDIASFKKKLELFKIDAADGLYPTTPPASIGLGFTKDAYQTGRNNVYYCTSLDRTEYALGVAVKPGNTGFMTTSSGAVQDLSYGPGDANVCGLVGRPNGSQMGYSWSGTTGTWQPWTN